jgi:hypothetical protein
MCSGSAAASKTAAAKAVKERDVLELEARARDPGSPASATGSVEEEGSQEEEEPDVEAEEDTSCMQLQLQEEEEEDDQDAQGIEEEEVETLRPQAAESRAAKVVAAAEAAAPTVRKSLNSQDAAASYPVLDPSAAENWPPKSTVPAKYHAADLQVPSPTANVSSKLLHQILPCRPL